jgi:hypothetical protein
MGVINREDAIEAFQNVNLNIIQGGAAVGRRSYMTPKEAVKIIENLPPAQQWIPFKTRPLTEEEKEEHPEWDSILDCKLPDDGQQILISVNVRGHERVQYDEFYTDDGCYLDSGYEIGTEAVAWCELPQPYREEQDGNT